MKYCWYEKSPQWVRTSEIIVCFSALCYWIYCTIKGIPWGNKWIMLYLSLYGAFCYWIFLCVSCALLKERKYSVSSNGISVRCLLGFSHEYSWNDFSEVSLCKVRFNPRDPRHYHVAIRCVVGEERKGPKTAKYAFEKWTTETYDAKHWRNIITIEYSEERFSEFVTACPLEIVDYRDLPNPT